MIEYDEEKHAINMSVIVESFVICSTANDWLMPLFAEWKYQKSTLFPKIYFNFFALNIHVLC